jgi:hypothetical protein
MPDVGADDIRCSSIIVTPSCSSSSQLSGGLRRAEDGPSWSTRTVHPHLYDDVPHPWCIGCQGGRSHGCSPAMLVSLMSGGLSLRRVDHGWEDECQGPGQLAWSEAYMVGKISCEKLRRVTDVFCQCTAAVRILQSERRDVALYAHGSPRVIDWKPSGWLCSADSCPPCATCTVSGRPKDGTL